MEGEERRAEIVRKLSLAGKPLSGTFLSKELNVSRQIIVGDIALLRAHGTEIIATNSGYILAEMGRSVKQTRIYAKHKLEDSFDEFCTIVDEGARIIDEGIVHDIYGEVRVPLNIESRSDAKRHTERMMSCNSEDLMILTSNNHFHTVEADNDLILLRVQRALHEKGYIVK